MDDNAADYENSDFRADSIIIDGDSATAKLAVAEGPKMVKFVKEDGVWKIQAFW
jgi:hypothetical protein